MWNTAKYKGVTNSWSALYDPKQAALGETIFGVRTVK